MYLIAHKTAIKRWISGIFQCREEALAYLAIAPSENQPYLIESKLQNYPVYLLESFGLEFSLLDVSEILQYCSHLERRGDDWCYGNLYLIRQDWQAPKVGADYMGLLPHLHLDNGYLERLQSTLILDCF